MKSRNELKKELSLKENLYLKQNLLQLMNILQCTILDLKSLVETKWMENPFIEVENNGFDSPIEETDLEEFGEKEDNFNLEQLIEYKKSFKEYLEDQIILFNFNEDEKEIAYYLIGNIDNNGFLKIPLKTIASQMKKSQKKVSKVLELLKKEIHPPGVFAKDTKECILIQLLRENLIKESEIEKYEELIDKILNNEKIDEKFYKKFEKIYLYPTKIFEKSINMYVTPEVYLKIEDNELKVYYNDKIFPRVKFNVNLYEDIKSRIFEFSKEERDFFKNKVKDAKDLIFLLYERQEKVFKVSQYLVNKQRNFFLNSGYLEVITLKEISKDLNLSMSTLSRIINEKYIDTPKGILPLKFLLGKEKVKKGFFGTKIKMIIKEIIDNEDKKNPYSDSEIMNILKTKGIYLKRRTIAKYRSELNIPSKKERKR